MKPIILVAETGSDINAELASQYQIRIVPMHVTFEDRTTDDGTFPVEEICAYYQNTRKVPKTSGSTPEDFNRVLDEIHAEYPDAHILYLAYSAVTTCSYQSCVIASEERDYVTCFDTKHVSVGQGSIVVAMAEALRANPDMTVEEALTFFEAYPRITRKLQTLYDVGLGYIRLGQPSTTLSGGEAQRVKLATELSRTSTGKTFYVLDEPTTGLHMADCERLVGVLQRLSEGGNSVLIIEHNLDVIKACDHVIDLGPEGGDGGGTLVCQGTPEEVAACERSYTGQYLKPVLAKSRRVDYLD